jgi:hypothetical protein
MRQHEPKPTPQYKSLASYRTQPTGELRWRRDNRPDYGPAQLQTGHRVMETGEMIWINVPLVVEDPS